MQIEKIRLKKLNNTRDLGGFPTQDGKKIKKGRLIRSGKLYKLPDKTINALKKAGVTTVIDLRTGQECSERPYCGLDGVKYVHIPLVCTATRGITHEKGMAYAILEDSKRIADEFGTADRYMAYVYDKMLFDGESCELLEKFMRILLEEDGCVLWYCNQGKDRTGIAAMLIEWLLGVDEELIIKDYAISDKFRRGKMILQYAGLLLVPGKRHFKELLRAMMKAKPRYIIDSMQKIKQNCGTIEKYFTDRLHFTESEIEALKNKYCE